MDQNILDLVAKQEALHNTLAMFKEELPQLDLIIPAQEKLAELTVDFQQRLTQAQKEGRNLNIAIMGQVKAGKSSFLNALLFGGKSILPEAATPKTANLTRISYAEKPSLSVEYYSLAEWESIKESAQSGGNDSITRASKELVTLIEQHNVDVQSVLNKDQEVIEAESLDELMGVLNEYTGNNGQFTALVKMTHLHLPSEALKGFDIVDTPGMNDPVISRTLRTQEEMARSDVVFFLSRCSQFLDQSDMSLLSEQLPGKGVKRLVLVGGQFDSTILDIGYDQRSLEAAEKHIHKRLSERATKEMEELAKRIEERSDERATLLRSLKTPILSSTYAYNFASFSREQWEANKGMAHVHQQLIEMAENEWSYYFTQEDWLRIANFDPLMEAYRQAREDKLQIIQSQIDSLLPVAEEKLNNFTQDLQDRLEHRINTLANDDLADLQMQKNYYLGMIHGITGQLADELGKTIDSADQMRRDVTKDLRHDQQQYSTVDERTGTRIESYTYTVNVYSKLNPLRWIGMGNETRTRTHSVDYQYVSATDAAAQVKEFAYECVNSIRDAFENIINTRRIRNDLKKALLDYLPADNQEFDPTFFRNVIDDEISQLAIPELHLEYSHLVNNITSNFQGEIKGSDIAKLQHTLSQTISDIFKDLVHDYEAKTKEIIQIVEKLQESLGDKLTVRLSNDLAKIEQEFADKEQNIQLYKNLQQSI